MIKETHMKPFTTLAVVVLALVAVMHVVRLSLGWVIVVNDVTIPMWVSAVGFILAGALSVMLYRESRK
jgi:hypothetical protein